MDRAIDERSGLPSMRRREVRGPQVEIGEDRGERRRQEERAARAARERARHRGHREQGAPPPHTPLPPSPNRFTPTHPP